VLCFPVRINTSKVVVVEFFPPVKTETLVNSFLPLLLFNPMIENVKNADNTSYDNYEPVCYGFTS
jgi:hypothetical protein